MTTRTTPFDGKGGRRKKPSHASGSATTTAVAGSWRAHRGTRRHEAASIRAFVAAASFSSPSPRAAPTSAPGREQARRTLGAHRPLVRSDGADDTPDASSKVSRAGTSPLCSEHAVQRGFRRCASSWRMRQREAGEYPSPGARHCLSRVRRNPDRLVPLPCALGPAHRALDYWRTP